MANPDIPSGLVPIGTVSGADFRGTLTEVIFAVGDAVTCFQGDLVKLTGTNDATGKWPVVAQATAGAAAIGVVSTFVNDFTDEGQLSTNYRKTLTEQKALIYWGPDVIYKIQEDSDGNAIEITEAGLNCNVIVGSGNTTTGISAMELDSTSAADTSSLNMRLIRVRNEPDNALGDNAIWEVSINASQHAPNQTGI